jgi:hypothetical protein
MEAAMKILDKTPYRTETGEIDILGRAKGTLTHGLNWYARIQAQDVVIAILEKVLGEKYVLARNVTLPDTEIELPLVLIGPQGVFLINVTHERGVYRAKDDEWGTVRAEKFVPAAINQVKRTLKLGRVLQVYLDRAGFKDMLVVDPILMSADPGTHIESTRPAVRIIMSDALERFAISINQGRAILSADVMYGIVKTILTGPKKAEAASSAESTAATPASGGRDTTDALFAGAQPQNPESLDFSYNPDAAAGQVPPRPTSQRQPDRSQNAEPQRATFQNTSSQNTASQGGGYQDSGYQDRDFQDGTSQNTGFEGLGIRESAFRDMDTPVFDASQPEAQAFDASQPESQSETESSPPDRAPKKRGLFGMTSAQLGILIALLLCWLCSMVAFAGYVYFNLNG